MFHHLMPEQKVAALAEAKRVLGPAGLFIVADFGRPRGTLQALLSALIHPLDGARNTAPHRRGQFEGMVRATFPDTTSVAAWRTIFGTIELFVCRKS